MYRNGNLHHLCCPNCDLELTSISTYKEMERDRIRWGWISREDADSQDLTLSDLGFCAECGGFVSCYDYANSNPEERALAEKAFETRVRMSVAAGRRNTMGRLRREASQRTLEVDWRFRPKGKIFVQDEDGFWIMSPEWKEWTQRRKDDSDLRARIAMSKLDRESIEESKD